MYDPTLGRWLSQDPLGFSAGDADLYRFVGNDPTGWTDPTGTESAMSPEMQRELAHLLGGNQTFGSMWRSLKQAFRPPPPTPPPREEINDLKENSNLIIHVLHVGTTQEQNEELIRLLRNVYQDLRRMKLGGNWINEWASDLKMNPKDLLRIASDVIDKVLEGMKDIKIEATTLRPGVVAQIVKPRTIQIDMAQFEKLSESEKRRWLIRMLIQRHGGTSKAVEDGISGCF